MTDSKEWESGTELNHAIVRHADQYQVEKFRKAKTKGAVSAIKQLLFLDIFSQLYSKELVGFGFRISPTLSDGPVKIEHHVFEVDPKLELAEKDMVEASGFRYERVRVVAASAAFNEPIKERSTKTEKVGRPDTFELSKQVLDVLFKTESNRAKSAAKLLPAFRSEFEKQFPVKEYETSAPAERTLREQIKRYWQELEEIGKNDFAK